MSGSGNGSASTNENYGHTVDNQSNVHLVTTQNQSLQTDTPSDQSSLVHSVGVKRDFESVQTVFEAESIDERLCFQTVGKDETNVLVIDQTDQVSVLMFILTGSANNPVHPNKCTLCITDFEMLCKPIFPFVLYYHIKIRATLYQQLCFNQSKSIY